MDAKPSPEIREVVKNQQWEIRLTHDEMRALVSMVRLEMGSGWTGVTNTVYEAGVRLLQAIDQVY